MVRGRVTLRLNDDLLAWVQAGAAEHGLDVASYVRMRLHQLKNGRSAVVSEPAVTLQVRGTLRPAEEPRHAIVRPEAFGAEGEPQVDGDALVRQALETAERTGQAQPRRQDDDDDNGFTGSVRPAGARHARDNFDMRKYAPGQRG